MVWDLRYRKLRQEIEGIREMKKLLTLLALSFIMIHSACNRNGTAPYDEAPEAPSGLYSITGDGEVTLYWNPVYEPDLREYALYTGEEELGVYEFDGVTSDTYYTFYIPNGTTRYLAVAAIDLAGNESDLSYETIWDTPRPEGYDLTVFALFYDSTQTNFERCALDFSDYDNTMVQALDNPSNDIYIDNYEGYLFLNAFDADTDVALFGLTSDLTDIDYVDPESVEWAEDGYVELIEDHSYIIWTYDNHFAAIRVEEVLPDRVILDWVYQTDAGNPQLKIVSGATAGQQKERKLMLHVPKKLK